MMKHQKQHYSTTAYVTMHSSYRSQQGVVLFIALIALIALTLAGIALVRSVDTSNLIAGNIAFKQAAIQASDLGVEAAFTALSTPNTIANKTNDDLNQNYYATMQPEDPNLPGVPAALTSAFPANNVIVNNATGNTIRYIIERMCSANGVVTTDICAPSVIDKTPVGGKSGEDYLALPPGVSYRVTVRVDGPRNTVSLVQALLDGPQI